MASIGGKRRSPVWEHFDLITPNKVRCLLCTQELSYNSNTSSMLRHLRAKHDENHARQVNSTEPVNPGYPDLSRKQRLDEALVDMIVKDSQPFSVVEDEGFRKFVNILDPTYTIPGRKALKAMMDACFTKTREKAMAEVRQAPAVSLTADMWTSINMDAYFAVTGHYVSETLELNTVLLGVQKFSVSHTAANLADATRSIMAEWAIADKVTAMITDGAHNIVASVNQLGVRHIYCFAHVLNLVVKKALAQTPELEEIRTQARKIVGYFKSSTTAKEKLCAMQTSMGMTVLKPVQEVETRWNSTFAMLQRLYELREPLGAALASLSTDIRPLSAEEYEATRQSLAVLRPFNHATVELSEEKRVAGSKAIPLVKMLKHFIAGQCAQMPNGIGAKLANNLKIHLAEKFHQLEKVTALSVATLLDPRFKEVGFCNQGHSLAAVERLTRECAGVITREAPAEANPVEPAPIAGSSQHQDYNLWALLDSHLEAQNQGTNSTATATVEVQRYLKEPHLGRSEDPLKYWMTRAAIYPHLLKLASRYLCIPASSVPCERIFSKAGEIVSQKRSRLKPRTVEKILFLNKNL